jgi:hypothetical protein
MAHNESTPSVLWLTTTQVKVKSHVTTDGQSVSLSWCQAAIWGPRLHFYYCHAVAGLLMWGALSDEWAGLSLNIAAGPGQSTVFFGSESSGTHAHILLSHVWDSSNLEGEVPRINIPQEKRSSVIPPGTGIPFRRLLCPAELRWRYSNSPPSEVTASSNWF